MCVHYDTELKLATKQIVTKFKRYYIYNIWMSDIVEQRQRLQDLLAKLNELGPVPDDIDQFTINANAVRKNDYLVQYNQIQSEIIDAYSRYVVFLEENTSSLLKLHGTMLDIIKVQIAK